MDQELPPAALPRRLPEGVHSQLLEARAPRPVCTRPHEGSAGEQLGPHSAGDPHLDATPVRQDDQRVHVLRGDDALVPRRRDQHLQHVQAHQPEDPAQRAEVRDADRRHGLREPELQRQAREHGRDQPAGAAGQHRRAHHQQLPEQGRVCERAVLPCLSCLTAASDCCVSAIKPSSRCESASGVVSGTICPTMCSSSRTISW